MKLEKLSQYREILQPYQAKAIATLPDLSPAENVEHCKDGIYTELGELLDTWKRHRYYGKELDIVNLIEECGDILWYTVCNFHVQKWDMLDFSHIQHTAEFDIIRVSCKTFDEYETTNQKIRNYIREYVPKFDTKELAQFALLRQIHLFEFMGFDLQVICDKNNEKLLKKRYKSGAFTAEEAINRDVVAERNSLEA